MVAWDGIEPPTRGFSDQAGTHHHRSPFGPTVYRQWVRTSRLRRVDAWSGWRPLVWARSRQGWIRLTAETHRTGRRMREHGSTRRSLTINGEETPLGGRTLSRPHDGMSLARAGETSGPFRAT